MTGCPPSGFRAPSRAFTDTTLGLPADAGFGWDSSLSGAEFEPYRPDSAGVLEIPVSHYLDDWGCLDDHRPVFRRWREIFDYAHQREPRAVFTLRPQVTGRAHHVTALELFLRYLRGFGDVWCATLSEIHRAWPDPPGKADRCEASQVDYPASSGLA